MRERKFKKSHIHILQTETLSRESRVTESVQEIVDSPLYLRTIDLCLPYVNTIVLLLGGCFSRMWGFTWKISNDRILWSHYKRSKGSHFVDRGFG